MIPLFKNTFRNIFNKNAHTLINVTGLSLGLTVFFLLYLYVTYEKSYDRFLSNSDNTYRVQLELFQDGKQQFNKATSTYSIGPLMKDNLTSVTQYARAAFERCLVYRNNVSYNDQELFWADSTFIDVVGVEMLQGNPKTALARPYTTVLSDKQAKIYFGDEDPMGKIIYINEQLPFTVTGIFKALPQNSHFNFKLVLSLSTGNELHPGWGTNNIGWGGYGLLYTYVNLVEGCDVVEVQKQLNELVLEHQPKTGNRDFRFHLQALPNIHLQSQLDNEFKVNGSAQSIKILLLIGILVLIIAWINFINIAGTEVFDHAKQISIRKVNGATQSHLISQVLFDIFLVNLISMLFSFVLILFSLSLFENIVGIPIRTFLQDHLNLLWILPLLTLAGSIFSGIYPAIVTSSFQPQKVLKGAIFNTKYKFSFKKVLVVFQMMATIALIVTALTIEKQMQYINSKGLGFSKDHIIMVKAPSILNMDSTKYSKFRRYYELVKQNHQVKEVTSTRWGIGEECLFFDKSVLKVDGEMIPVLTCKSNFIDENFTDVFGLEILAGEKFKIQDYNKLRKVIINETASRMLGFETPSDAVGHYLHISNNTRIIIQAVINDYNQESLKQAIKPMFHFHRHPAIFGRYSILVAGDRLNETTEFLKKNWEVVYPNSPFDYEFLDQQLAQLYSAEVRFGKLLLGFTLFTILIACLGLFGLIMIITRRSIKEIGIRKVNGAKISEIMLFLNRDFVIWVAIAFIVATPIAYYAMHKWLENFAYKTTLSWWIFALAGVLALGIALLTVSFQSWKAATRNPVEALRYE